MNVATYLLKSIQGKEDTLAGRVMGKLLGFVLEKGVDYGKLSKKKVPVKLRSGKVIMAYRHFKTDSGKAQKLAHRKSKVLIDSLQDKDSWETSVQKVVNSDLPPRKKVNDLIHLGIWDKDNLVQLSGATETQAYNALNSQGLQAAYRQIAEYVEEEDRKVVAQPLAAPAEEIKTIAKEQTKEVAAPPSEEEAQETGDFMAFLEAEGIGGPKKNIIDKDGKDDKDRQQDFAVDMVLKGRNKLATIYGTGGLGKTYGTEKQLEKRGKRSYDAALKGLKDGQKPKKDDYDYIKITGSVSPASVYKTLYEHKDKIILFDDADGFLKDPDGLNMLKGAFDTSGKEKGNYISKLTSAKIKDDDGNEIPKRFFSTAKAIILTNLNVDNMPDAEPVLKGRGRAVNVSRTTKETLDKLKIIGNKFEIEGEEEGKEYSQKVLQRSYAFLDKTHKWISSRDLNARTAKQLFDTAEFIQDDKDFLTNALNIFNLTPQKIKARLAKGKK